MNANTFCMPTVNSFLVDLLSYLLRTLKATDAAAAAHMDFWGLVDFFNLCAAFPKISFSSLL